MADLINEEEEINTNANININNSVEIKDDNNNNEEVKLIESQKLEQTDKKSYKFEVPPLETVNKIPKCSYVSERNATYFLCPCSEGFTPICEECKDQCHKHPEAEGKVTPLEVQGKYICSCGKSNHEVKKINEIKSCQCFYAKFFEVTPNKGFKKIREFRDNELIKEEVICSVCSKHCKDFKNEKNLNFNFIYFDQKYDEEVIIKEEEEEDKKIKITMQSDPNLKQLPCQCEMSHSRNIINLNNEFLKNQDFSKYMRHFNANILFKIQKTKQLYIQDLIDNLYVYLNKKPPSGGADMKFFPDFLTSKILDLFSYFFMHWKTKYVSVPPFLNKIGFDELLTLLDYNKKHEFHDEETAERFFSGNMNYAELLFNHFIKSHIIEFNNLFSLKTIINMPIGLRYLFIVQAKNFYKFGNKYKNKYQQKLESINETIEKYADTLISMFKSFEDYNQKYKWDQFAQAFATFHRIMHYLVKYHLVTKNQLKNYFDITLDFLYFYERQNPDQSTKKETSGQEKVYLYILQSVFYSALFINDDVTISHICSKNKKNLFSRYMFSLEDTEELNLILNKVFVLSFKNYDRSKSIKGSISYNFIVKKIFELLLSKENDFYYKNLQNIQQNDKELIEHFENLIADNKEIESEDFKYFTEYNHKQPNYTTEELTENEIPLSDLENPEMTISSEEQPNNIAVEIEEDDIKMEKITDENEHLLITQSIYNLCEEFGNDNRNYFEFNVPFEYWQRRSAKNIEKFIKSYKAFIGRKLKIIEEIRKSDKKNKMEYTDLQPQNEDRIDTEYHLLADEQHNEQILEEKKMDLFAVAKRDVISQMKNIIIQSNFLQKIDEFIYIFAKGKIFKENNASLFLSKSSLCTIVDNLLDFFMDLIDKDFTMLILLMNLNPEYFVLCFTEGEETKRKIYEFLGYVLNMLLENKSKLSKDTFYFYIGCLRHLIFIKGTDIRHLTEITGLASKGIRAIMNIDANYCTIVELFSELFDELTKRFDKYYPVIPEDKRNEYKSYDKICNFFQSMEQDTDLINFYVNYFLLLSNLKANDFYLFNCIKKEINDFNDIEERIFGYLNGKWDYKSPKLEYALFRYYFNKKLSYNISIDNLDAQIYNLFYKKLDSQSGIKNITICNLTSGNFNNNRESQTYYMESNYKSRAQSRKSFNQLNFKSSVIEENEQKDYFYKDLVNSAKILRQVIKKFKAANFNEVALSYYEHVILRPLYILINYFLQYSHLVEGSDSYIIYETVFYFFKATLDVYGARENNPEEDISVRVKIDNINLEKIIHEELRKFSEDETDDYAKKMKNLKGKIKYFELEKIVFSFLKVVKCVIKDSADIDYYSLGDNEESGDSNKEEYLQYSKDYIDEKDKCKNDKSVLIRTLNNLFTETGNDYRDKLIEYLLNKIFDPVNENYVFPDYFYSLSYEENGLIRENIKNLYPNNENRNYFYGFCSDTFFRSYPNKMDTNCCRIENVYSIEILNELFLNGSKKFQDSFTKIYPKIGQNDEGSDKDIEENPQKLAILTYMIKNLIFSSNLAEILRRFELDYPNSEDKLGKNDYFTYYISINCLKFIQNLCEGHNKENQNFFFNSFFSEDQAKDSPKEQKRNSDGSNLRGSVTKVYDNLNRENEENEPNNLPSDDDNQDIDNPQRIQNKRCTYSIAINEEADKGDDNSKKNKDDEGDGKGKKNRNKNKNSNGTFINFLFLNMQMIINNVHPSDENLRFLQDIFKKMPPKDLTNLIKIFVGIRELIIEMLQGTDINNYHYIYSKEINDNQSNNVEDSQALNAENNEKKNEVITEEKLSPFMETIRMISGDDSSGKIKASCYSELLHPLMYNFKFSLFKLINTIISQELKTDHPIIKKLNELCNYDKILSEIIVSLTKAQILIDKKADRSIFPNKPQKKVNDKGNSDLIEPIEEDDEEDENNIVYDILRANEYDETLKKCLLDEFKKNEFAKNEDFESKKNEIPKNEYFELKKNEFAKNEYFELGSEMFLFITRMALKYKLPKPVEIMELKTKELSKKTDGQNNSKKDDDEKNKRSIESKQTEENANNAELIEKINRENNRIIICKFFSSIIKKVEFRVKEGDKLVLKSIYFVIDPIFYGCENSIDDFNKNVDRNSSSTKIRGLIEAIDDFFDEAVESKKNSENVIDFKHYIKVNLWIAVFVNFLLLIFKSETKTVADTIFTIFILLVIACQVCMNLYLIIQFFKKKYKFYYTHFMKKIQMKNQEEIEGFEPSQFQKVMNNITKFWNQMWYYFNIYIWNAFVINKEIRFINLVTILGIFGLFSRHRLFWFILQTLIVVELLDPVKEIIMAFQKTFLQLVCMIGFLAILMVFYANIGFYFYVEDFVTETGDGNYCENLLECVVLYFNFGVRAGGGIGDELGDKPFTDVYAYLFRFFWDIIFWITIVLLLLNMINGSIVSTFSNLREESQKRDDDINDKCFICDIHRNTFENKQLDFGKHVAEEHCLKDYIMYFIKIKRIDSLDLDSDQNFILDCLKEKQNQCFPLKMCESLGEGEDNDENNDDDEEQGDD